MAKFKSSESVGSAPPDPNKNAATVAPIPTPVLANKPAPGQKGPVGMAPRTTYSRVNTGLPPVPALGAAQKSSPIRGLEHLPAKVASSREVPMSTIHTRPSLQDMVKHAMSGAAHKVAVNLEAARQLAATEDGEIKEASAPQVRVGHVATEQVIKLANALGFIADQVVKEAEGPGDGPGALQVMEATSSETNIDAGESGQATAGNQPPKSPSTQAEEVQTGKANTGLETNDDMSHPEQPVEPISNEKVSALTEKNANRLRSMMEAGKRSARGVGEHVRSFGADAGKAAKEVAGRHPKTVRTGAAVAGGAAAGFGARAAYKAGQNKEGSAPLALIRKTAEDAINPAQIDGGGTTDPAEPPAAASASEEKVPSEPSDVNSQKRLISSNQAAIDYTKGQAKADPKKDVNQVLTEPALSAAHDTILDKTLDNTGAAGVKISSAQNMAKTAQQVGAQRVLISRLVKRAQEESEKKKKQSMGGAAPSTPQAATGVTASTMGM